MRIRIQGIVPYITDRTTCYILTRDRVERSVRRIVRGGIVIQDQWGLKSIRDFTNKKNVYDKKRLHRKG